MKIAPIGAISRVMLFVRDVPKVAAFYREGFGLEPIGEADDEWAELRTGSCTLALHRAVKTLKERGHSSAKIVFGVKEIAAAKALLEERGMKLGKIRTFGEIEMCDGKDPEGNLFQISNRGM